MEMWGRTRVECYISRRCTSQNAILHHDTASLVGVLDTIFFEYGLLEMLQTAVARRFRGPIICRLKNRSSWRDERRVVFS